MISKRFALAASAVAMTAAAIVATPARTTSLPPSAPDALDDVAMLADGDGRAELSNADGAGGPGFAGHRGPGRRGLLGARRLADYLDMSEQQREDARKLVATRRDQVRPLWEERRALRERLKGMLGDPGASDVAVGQLVKQMHANREALVAARKTTQGQLAALLDDAQRAKLEQLRSLRREFAESGRRHRGDFRR